MVYPRYIYSVVAETLRAIKERMPMVSKPYSYNPEIDNISLRF